MGRRRRWPTCQRTCKVPCRLEAVRGRAGDRGEEGRGACLSGSLTAARRVCFFFGTRTALHRPPPAVHPIPVPPRRRWPSPLPTRLPVVLRRPAGRTGAHAATGAAGGDSVGREARLGGHRPSRPSSCDLASSAATAAGAASAAAATAPLLCPPPPPSSHWGVVAAADSGNGRWLSLRTWPFWPVRPLVRRRLGATSATGGNKCFVGALAASGGACGGGAALPPLLLQSPVKQSPVKAVEAVRPVRGGGVVDGGGDKAGGEGSRCRRRGAPPDPCHRLVPMKRSYRAPSAEMLVAGRIHDPGVSGREPLSLSNPCILSLSGRPRDGGSRRIRVGAASTNAPSAPFTRAYRLCHSFP